VSAACAARHPERVSRLFLGSFQARTHPQLIAVCQRCVELIDRGRAREEMADFFIREFGAGLPDSFRPVMRRQFASVTDAQLLQMRRQCATLAAGADLREIVDLNRITAKVLIVNGADDPLVDVTDHEITDLCFPKAECHVLAGVGHFLHLERPALIDLYLDFMRGTADDADLQPFTMPTPTPRQETVMLTELQKQKFTRMFHAIDANQNGCIETADAARLASELARVRGYTPGDPQYEATQRRYLESMALMLPFSDAAGRVDNAGFLAYHDWLLNTPGAYQLAVQRLVEFVFTALDEDGDGEVTLDEAREFYVACGMSEAVAETVFARIDLDNDGFLTQAEVTDIVTQYYFSSDPQVPGNWLFGPFPGIMAVTL
jgi:Ca2+-binding EF-hand superfamily protein